MFVRFGFSFIHEVGPISVAAARSFQISDLQKIQHKDNNRQVHHLSIGRNCHIQKIKKQAGKRSFPLKDEINQTQNE